ncbi:hypothetical protein LPJ73_003767 [Coemansia sp. RSA 2703]|nr:hypothetical protein LPJ73_003767 [Coemansia sp. RSA 2703]
MILDATPKTAKPSPPPPPSQQHTQHHHQYHSQQAFMPGYAYARPPLSATDISTPTSAMIESPTVSSSGFTGSRGQSLLPPPPHSYSGSLPSTSVAGGSGKVILNDGAQQKVEKNRFQANIRSFVDQHFTVPQNPQWDYHQSFKAPRNALATQNIIQAFHADHGSPYDRIEHGLSVYFSSLKAKFRTTEDKAMLKQQRDRRRARRIKKAAGRRKVFDQTQFPFLPKEFETHLCFIPSAMSPEHTDDDGEVKVGMLPWRAVKFTRLFKHLDTLRPKRTPRPNNPELIGARAPPPDVPLFMIDPEFVALDRAQQEHHDPEEEDIEMDSMSDGD